MGIFSRFNNVLKSNLNSLLDKAEDPEKLLEQTVVDMEGEVKRARKEIVQTLGNAKRLEKKLAEHEDEAKDWEKKAVLALKEGDEDLAREALRRKQRANSTAENVRTQMIDQQAAADSMKDTLERIEEKIEDLKARKGTLAAQVKRARASDGDPLAPSTTSGHGGAFGELERMGGRIEQMEAEIEAASILDDPRDAEVDARFRALEREGKGDALDDELAALKAQLDD